MRKVILLLVFFLVVVFPFSFFIIRYSLSPLALADDVVNITASIKPKPTDIELSITTSSPANGTNFIEEEEVTVTVTYRSLIPEAQSLLLEANWPQGRINNSPTNLTDALEYVAGSATTSEGGTVPVIDLQNNTVTWDINSVVGTANSKSVSFKLVVDADLNTNDRIYNDLVLAGTFGGVILSDQTTTITIQGEVAGPTSTPGPGPSATTTPATPTPLLAITPLTLQNVSLVQVTNNSVILEFNTTPATTYTLSYGKTVNKLTQKIKGLTATTLHQVTISPLENNTQYYFQIRLQDNKSRSLVSDLYTFTTASEAKHFVVSEKQSSVMWQQLILATGKVQNVILPKEILTTINVNVQNPGTIEKVVAKFESSKVLGIFFPKERGPTKETTLTQILPGIFYGVLFSPEELGEYQITLQISDIYGGYYSQALPYSIYVSKPLYVYNEHNQQPVEKAKIKIFKYDAHTKLFQPFEESLGLPQYTDAQGQLNLSLPTGQYLLEVSAAGYHPLKNIHYELNAETQGYPQIGITTSNRLIDRLAYYQEAITDLAHYSYKVSDTLSLSRRAYSSLLKISQAILIVVGFLLLSLRLHIGLLGLPLFFWEWLTHFIRRLLKIEERRARFRIFETNNQHKAIPGVRVHIHDSNNQTVLKTKSNVLGEFFIPKSKINKNDFPLTIVFYKKHYIAYSVKINQDTFMSQEEIKLRMEKEEIKFDTVFRSLDLFKEFALVIVSDTFVFLTVIVSVLIVKNYGFWANWPFLFSAFFMMIFWALYVKKIWEYQLQVE